VAPHLPYRPAIRAGATVFRITVRRFGGDDENAFLFAFGIKIWKGKRAACESPYLRKSDLDALRKRWNIPLLGLAPPTLSFFSGSKPKSLMESLT